MFFFWNPYLNKCSILTGTLATHLAISHREAGLVTGRPSLSQGGFAALRQVGPSTGRLGSQEGPASHMGTGPLTERPGLSQGGQASHTSASKLANKIYQNLYFQKITHIISKILAFATKR